MKSPPLQRELVPAQVKKLLDIAGQTRKGLLRLIPEHKIIIGISGKAINVESLSHDSRGPFETVEFTDLAPLAKCILYAGQHRIVTLKHLLEETIKEEKLVKERLIDQPENITIQRMHSQLVTALQEKGRWLVAFYDIGKATTIRCYLVSNNVCQTQSMQILTVNNLSF
jgi:hypothetical protein